ncbi:ComEC/Rec2 family competence protein [Clostridium sardiniense]|uniref:ComEC/Rec2 family competence protein n=1 Tax=Clostridium sardiniense TaxID=29369 RepID=UPI003D359268
MKIFEIGKVKLPILYIAITLLISSLYYRYFDRDLGLAITLVSLLFLWVFLKEGKEFLVFILFVFIIGVLINNNFYNLNINEYETIRVERNYSYGGIGKVDGRKIILKGDLKGCKEGDLILARGSFKRDIDKEKGIIGEFKIKEFKIYNKSIFTKLAKLKEKFKEKLTDNIGIRKASLVTSIVFGRDSTLDKEDEEYMNRFGVIHALSVSGLHIGIIFLIFKKLINEKASLVMTFIYVIMTGIAFSSLRAFIMLLFSNLGFILKRKYNPIGGIAISAIIIFIMAPYCIFNIGFLLSFSATIGILLYSKKIRRKLYKIPEFLGDTISISLAAQIFTLPLLIIFFNEFSIGFIVGNIILIPIINLILIIGVICIGMIGIQEIFDFLSFILNIIINILDDTTDIFINFVPETLNITVEYAYFYISLLITYYLYKRGVKKIIVLPIAYMVFISINLYSLNPKITYRKEGGLVISYKGDRIIVSDKKANMDDLKSKTASSKGYKDFKKINISDSYYLEKEGKDYILSVSGSSYYLNVSGGNKKEVKYDIINFKENEASEIIILGDDILVK